MDHADIFHTVEDLAHRGEILTIHAHSNGLEACDRLDNLGENLLSGLGAATPDVRSMRPQNPGTLLLLVLAGHVEAVFFRGRFALVDGLHRTPPFGSLSGQHIACPCGKVLSMVLVSPFAEQLGTFRYPKVLVLEAMR